MGGFSLVAHCNESQDGNDSEICYDLPQKHNRCI